jgi:hypothetical protein
MNFDNKNDFMMLLIWVCPHWTGWKTAKKKLYPLYKHSKKHQKNSSLLSKHLNLRPQHSQGISWIIETSLAEQMLLYVLYFKFSRNWYKHIVPDINGSFWFTMQIFYSRKILHFGIMCMMNDEMYQHFAKLFQKFYLSTNLN